MKTVKWSFVHFFTICQINLQSSKKKAKSSKQSFLNEVDFSDLYIYEEKNHDILFYHFVVDSFSSCLSPSAEKNNANEIKKKALLKT
jgi:hypothetical protein